MSRHQTLRVSLASGVLLLAGCGSQSGAQEPPVTPSGAAGTSAGAVSATTPSAAGTGLQPEGTGSESPLAPGNGGISLPVPTLPIGVSADPQPTDEKVCILVNWVGTLHPGNTVAVTSIAVSPPYQETKPDACPGAVEKSCATARFTAGQGGATCAAAAIGKPGSGTGTALVTITGELSCPAGQSAACHQDLSELAAEAAAASPSFSYSLPPDTTGPSSPTQASPSTPATNGTSSPAPSDSSAS